MTLEDGLEPLEDELEWWLADLDIGGLVYYDEGLDGFEVDSDDGDEVGVDGDSMGFLRLPGRPVTLGLRVWSEGADEEAKSEAMEAWLDALALVTNPLPDRSGGLRSMRFKRRGAVGKRLYYRGANGQVLAVPGDEARINYNKADIVIRLHCPNPIIYSDEYEDHVFTAGETKTITNDGTLAALLPTAWDLRALTTVRLQNLTHDEDITFPSTGNLRVTRDMEITAPGTYGQCYGPDNTPFPNYPLLHPGDNSIKASAACTLRTWSTWS